MESTLYNLSDTLIMGLTPNPDGLLPESDVIRLKEWGDEIRRRFSDPVASISGSGSKIEIKLKQTQKINHIVLQEEIAKGERIREFKVEALINGTWKTLCDGTVVGHKHIRKFDEIATSRIRLITLGSIDEPIIKNFAVYYVE